ncbi:MAG: TraR/DksA family transcriptional regulator [Rhodocyclaceae bacterium]|nr:TraR/DksA family transcriptional regulator [Rhodocyclaceae bacterium]
MTDVFDRATEVEEALREDALQRQARRAGLTGKTWRDSAGECRVCGGGIPLKRRRAVPGVQTCIECQTDLERAVI